MNIEETIQQVENIYERITGQKVPTGEIRNPITPDVDPMMLIEARYNEMLAHLQDPGVRTRLEPWTPAMCVWETEKSIIVRVDLPQVKKEDVDISLRGNTLLVSGIRRNTQEQSGMYPRMNEVRFGPFYRAVILPIQSLDSNLQSSLVDGVLEISLPKNQVTTDTESKTSKSKKVQ